MDDIGLDIAVRMLAHGILKGEEPSPEQVEEWREPLKGHGLFMIGSLFLNIRLAIRWRGFGITTLNALELKTHPVLDRALTMNVRVYTSEVGGALTLGLRESGFTDLQYSDSTGGNGGWVHATVPPLVIDRYGALTGNS